MDNIGMRQSGNGNRFPIETADNIGVAAHLPVTRPLWPHAVSGIFEMPCKSWRCHPADFGGNFVIRNFRDLMWGRNLLHFA